MVGFGDLWVCCCGLLEDLWLAVGCCGRRIVVAGGVCGGLAVMVLISGGFFCFVLRCSKHCKIFVGSFS